MALKEQIIELWASGQFKTQNELADSLSTTSAYVSKVLLEKKMGRNNGGDFDLKAYLRANMADIAKELVDRIKTGKGTKGIELALKALGELVEKREDTVRIEYSSREIARDADGIIRYFQQRNEEAGVCVVCGKPIVLLAEVCDNQEH